MRILALEFESPDVPDEAFRAGATEEAAALWELVQAGIVRETDFRADRAEAVLLLECRDIDEARERLGALPYVRGGLIRFELIGLRPYPGFARLFGPPRATAPGRGW